MVECRDGVAVGNQPSTPKARAPAFILALMGLPGAGKSACLDALGVDRSKADMDSALGGQAPPLETTLAWLRGSGQPIVVVGAHATLSELVRAVGASGQQRPLIYFVYLRKPKHVLARHLTLAMAEGRRRDEASQRDMLDHFDRRDDELFRLADRTIECTDDTAATASAVRALQRELSAVGDNDNSGTMDETTLPPVSNPSLA